MDVSLYIEIFHIRRDILGTTYFENTRAGDRIAYGFSNT